MYFTFHEMYCVHAQFKRLKHNGRTLPCRRHTKTHKLKHKKSRGHIKRLDTLTSQELHFYPFLSSYPLLTYDKQAFIKPSKNLCKNLYRLFAILFWLILISSLFVINLLSHIMSCFKFTLIVTVYKEVLIVSKFLWKLYWKQKGNVFT